MVWVDVFAFCYEWQWASERMGNYIENGKYEVIEYLLVKEILTIIKNEKMRIFFKDMKKK